MLERTLKHTPFCPECKYYGGKEKCNHPTHGGKWPHIGKGHWCRLGEGKEATHGQA